MQRFDLAIAYDWEHDADLVALLQGHLNSLGLNAYIVKPENLEFILDSIGNGQLLFTSLFDRASDTSAEFVRLQSLLSTRTCEIIEPIEKMRWAMDKATMHLEFVARGVRTPYTVILPPLESDPEPAFSREDLASLGTPFVIKPANTTGGGQGVIKDAAFIEQIHKARQEYPRDKYLIQENIEPYQQDGLIFWFRVFYAFGLILCSWWNPHTFSYRGVSDLEMETFKLSPLKSLTESIARICRLRLFSTEIAMDAKGQFVTVDYVNESPDLRLQSIHIDGIPDDMVNRISMRLARYVETLSLKVQRSS